MIALRDEKKLVEVPVVVVNKPGGAANIGLIYLTQHVGRKQRAALRICRLGDAERAGKRARSRMDDRPDMGPTASAALRSQP